MTGPFVVPENVRRPAPLAAGGLGGSGAGQASFANASGGETSGSHDRVTANLIRAWRAVS